MHPRGSIIAVFPEYGAGLGFERGSGVAREVDDAALTDQVTADVLRVLGMSAQEAEGLAFSPLRTGLA